MMHIEVDIIPISYRKFTYHTIAHTRTTYLLYESYYTRSKYDRINKGYDCQSW
jgi:hypothetical protein